MLLNPRIILLGLSAVSSGLADGSQESDHGISISDEYPSTIDFFSSSGTDATWSDNDEDTDVSINDAQPKDHSHSDDFSDFLEEIDDNISTAFTTPWPSAAAHGTNNSTTSTTSPSSATSSVASSIGALDPIKAALDWLTSMPNSTSSTGQSASSVSISSTSCTGPHHTTTASTKTATDPAKVALDWLTSGLDDKSTPPTTATATTTDLKHSNVVSSIISELEATHTSAAAANRLRPGFW